MGPGLLCRACCKAGPVGLEILQRGWTTPALSVLAGGSAASVCRVISREAAAVVSIRTRADDRGQDD